MRFEGLDPPAAAAFCTRWLPAWTGGDAEGLVAFYAPDAYYADPAVPQGIRGRAALLEYFGRLLRRYPEWVWRHRRSVPAEDGFLNFWTASLGPEPGSPSFDGVCLVQLRDGLIQRNEVFFDPAPLRAGAPESAR